MVFQSYAIWPHMTVFNNVAFPLKQQKVRKNERERLVMEALALVQMKDLAHRPAPYLSGGQQQRVALARALVSEPQVLLLDEPLSNLDAKLREELRLEIKELLQRLNITAVYVTHDQAEALAMSDRVAVMFGGKILQEANPKELYLKPNAKFVAQFIGQVNFFEGTVSESSRNGIGVVKTGQGDFRCGAFFSAISSTVRFAWASKSCAQSCRLPATWPRQNKCSCNSNPMRASSCRSRVSPRWRTERGLTTKNAKVTK